MINFRRWLLLFVFLAKGLCAFGAVPINQDGLSLSPEEQAQGYRNGHVLVKMRDAAVSTGEAVRQAAETRVGIRSRRVFEHLKNQEMLEFDPSQPVLQVIKQLRATGLYEIVEADRVVHGLAAPNDPSFGQQWSLSNAGQNGGTPGADIGAIAGWSIQSGAPNVIVAILDSGMRLTHSDLAANLWTNPSPSSTYSPADLHGINASVTPATGNPNDDNGHGSHVSGIIGAVGNNSIGISGVAQQVQLMPLKFLDSTGSGSLSAELACFNYAIAHGASIINGSFGSNGYSPSEFAGVQALQAAGIIFVVAAGNDGLAVEPDAAYPAGYLLDNIVSVGATTHSDTLASYSNFSAGLVDLGAPGGDATSTGGIYSTYNRNDTDYAVLRGTSMAAPHVAGALALLKAKFPGDTYRQLINRLLRSVTPLSSLSGLVQSGGRLNLAQALSSTVNTPINDNFANRAFLAGSFVQVRSSNVGASVESGEPAISGATGGASLWWTWTAPASGPFKINTAGSSYDTLLAVYTGSALNALQSVAANDDVSASDHTSAISLNATAGTTYQIAVQGKAGVAGPTFLTIAPIPPNDNFAAAQALSGSSVTATGSTLGASLETGESDPTGKSGGHSVWYQWTAPAAGHYNLAAYSTAIDTISAIYTGSSLSNLALVGANDDSISYNTDSLVSFNATAGQKYFIQIDNVDPSGSGFTVSINDSLWQYPSGTSSTTSPAVGSDGTVYFASQDQYVYAIRANGTELWERATGNSVDIASPAIGSDGTVYVGSDDGFLYALNGSTGIRKWRFAADTGISSTPAIGADGTIYLRDDNGIHALTPGASSATEKWKFFIGSGGTYGSPSVGTDGTIYVGAAAGSFYAFNPDGTQKWKFTANGDVYTTPAIGGDGTIYFGTYGSAGTLYALNPDSSKKWTWAVPGGGSITSSPAIGPDGTVYFGAYDHKLHAISSGGVEKWSYTAGDEIHGSSPAVASDGTVYFGDLDGKVYAVNADGSLKRTYASADEVHSSPIVANGVLYFSSDDAKLYAFNATGNPAASAWPVFHQNALHTGLAVASGTLTTINTQPQSQNVTPGSGFTLTVAATGPGTLSYQWYKDGIAIAGATGATYRVASAAVGDAATYTVVITSSSGTVTSSGAVITVGTNTASRLVNISARAQVGTGGNVLIVGFIISGSGSKQVLLRGVGPTLGTSPFNVPGVLATPTLNLFDANSNPLPYSNTGWGGGATLSTAFTNAGAFALSSSSADDALLVSLPASKYTAQISGVNSTTGVALAEIYDTDAGNSPTRLANISARAQVGTDGNVLIAGFIISGTTPKQVLIRATGPALAALGVPGTLSDPRLDVYNAANVVVQSNDNWGDNGGAAALSAAFNQVGAFPLPDTTSKDAALLITLAPGAYTAKVSGVNNTTGVALIELYEMP